ncbi:MAG TPA: thiol peroxidase [Limnochordales bacterium]
MSQSLPERTGEVTMRGNPVTLVGPRVEPGQKAPDFRVVDTDLKPRTLSDYAGQVLLIASVPSLDTGVCDAETRRFNQEAVQFGPDVRVLTVSMDLPFAQRRWCGAAGVDRVVTLSDHREASFGTAYGVLIKELRLLARAVFVVDRGGVVRYVEYVPEVTQHPNYEAAIQAVRQASAGA